MSDATGPDWQPSKRLERGNAAEQILEDLRDRILSGQLPRGTKLPTEKQLAEGYGVSGATVREAVRGLVTAQLIEVRHGSGAYVTAQTDQLIAASLSSMIQIERIGVPQVLGVLGALISYAAELAAKHATAEDIEAMRQALRQIQDGDSAEGISGAVSAFVGEIGQASGNPLLAALCRFFTSLQIGAAARSEGDRGEGSEGGEDRRAGLPRTCAEGHHRTTECRHHDGDRSAARGLSFVVPATQDVTAVRKRAGRSAVCYGRRSAAVLTSGYLARVCPVACCQFRSQSNR
jgi:GntR family transcriptional repressor for pyruvate dehydrogenase complex